jgi:stress response protein YsnF
MTEERSDRDSIPLVKEEATVAIREVTTGKFRVRSETDVHAEVAHADLTREEVEIVRVPADRPVDAVPEIRTEGNVTIFPIVEEVLFIEKRLVLREEIHLIRKPTSEHVEIPVSLRRQRGLVEEVDPASGRVLASEADDPIKD